jgi:hypothetical protein
VQRFPPSAWVWRNGELAGMTRYVVALPHPNARVSAHNVGGNVGTALLSEVRAFLRTLHLLRRRSPDAHRGQGDGDNSSAPQERPCGLFRPEATPVCRS